MKFQKISDRIYANTDGRSGGNVGIIKQDWGVLAVDSQYPASAVDFRNSISALTERSVTHLLLTHYHGDHVFGSQAFEDCEIVGHRLLKEKMEENLRTIWAPENLEKLIDEVRRSRPENVVLYKGLRIVLPRVTFDTRLTLDDVEMVNLGGHTECSSIVYIPNERVLFAGDLLFAERFPWGGDPTADPDKWMLAFRRILGNEIDVIVPGHGPLCDKSEVREQLRWFEATTGEVKKLIAEGASVEQVVRHTGYPNFYPSERPEWRENTLRHWYKFYSGRKGGRAR